MNLKSDSAKPIFIQVKEWIESEILADRIKEGDKVFSQNELARIFMINPMTALRGISLLESSGVLRKSRGIGMFVTEGAKEIIYRLRRYETLSEIMDDLVAEVMLLKMSKKEILEMVSSRLDNIAGGQDDRD